MAPKWVTHPCGVTWHQIGNNTGHCAACHRTFDGLRAFDAHQAVVAGRVICSDPASLTRQDGSPVFASRTGGGHPLSDEAERPPDAGTVYWRLTLTEARRNRLAAFKAKAAAKAADGDEGDD